MTDDTTRGAERYVLGAMLLDARCIDDINLAPAEHYDPKHETIHAAVLAVHESGARPDLLTVAEHLRQSGDLPRIGGAAYLAGLQQDVPTAASAGFYADVVREAAAKRAVIATGTRLVQQAGSTTGDVPAADLVEAARKELDQLADRITTPGADDLPAAIEAAVDALEKGVQPGIKSPWSDLDRLTGGWRRGAFYIVAARPGVGKSVVGVQAAVAAAKVAPALMFSLEMGRDELVNRALSALGSVDLSPARLARDALTEREWEKVARATADLSGRDLVIDDRPNVTMTDIRARARSMVRRRGELSLVVIDYLQLMTSGKRVESRQQEVSEFSRSLKLLAKELSVPVIAICQLNRGSEQRQDKRPAMHDLRESGSLEQDADCVILLHRDVDEAPDDLMVGVPKNRGGPPGSFAVNFEGAYSRITQRAWTPSAAAG